MNNLVVALTSDAGNLYAGGGFTTAGEVSADYIAKWDGTSWSALGSGMNDWVSALTCDSAGNLYAGGWFTTAGGVPADYIAKWNGTSWAALGSGVDDSVWALSVRDNALFVGGYFTQAGGKDSRYIALWQPRVDVSRAMVSATPGPLTIGNARYGFYKPSLELTTGTTVSYAGGLPTTVTLERAPAITVGGQRVNGAFVVTPTDLSFGGTGAELWVEFSEDDVAAYGVPAQDFRVAALTYPSTYPSDKEAVSVSYLGNQSEPTFVRMENGRKIYGIRVEGVREILPAAYGAVPFSSPSRVSTWDLYD